MDENIIERAVAFAKKAHEGQFRKGTDVPYIVHPVEAMEIVKTLTDDEEVIAAAVLHDVIEDTAYTEEDIRSEFGGRVAELVKAESENKRKGIPEDATWKIRKTETIKEMKTAPIDAKMICLGDKLSNARAIVRDYEAVGEKLWERFNASPEEIAWYYTSMTEALKDLESTDAWKELSELMERKAFNRETEKFENDPPVNDLHLAIEGQFADTMSEYEERWRDVRWFFMNVLRKRCMVYVPCMNKEKAPDGLYTAEDVVTGLEYAVMLTQPDDMLNRASKVDVLDFLLTVVNADSVNGIVIDPNGSPWQFSKIDIKNALDAVRKEREWLECRYGYAPVISTAVIPERWSEKEKGEGKLLHAFCVDGDTDFPLNIDVPDEDEMKKVKMGEKTQMKIWMYGLGTVVYDDEKDYLENKGKSQMNCESLIPSGTYPTPKNKDGWKPTPELIMNAAVIWVDDEADVQDDGTVYLNGACRCMGHEFAFSIPKPDKHLHKGSIISGKFLAWAEKVKKNDTSDAVSFSTEFKGRMSETQYCGVMTVLRGLRNRAYEHVVVDIGDAAENAAKFIQAVKTDEILDEYRVEIGFDEDGMTRIYAKSELDFEEAALSFREFCVNGGKTIDDAEEMGFGYYDCYGGDDDDNE